MSSRTLVGKLADRFARKRAGMNLAVAGILAAWFVLVIVPIVVLFVFSFFSTVRFRTVYEPTLDTWIGLFSSGRWEVTLRTLRIALTVTGMELLLAFPFALWLAKSCKSGTGRAVCLAMLTIPFFLDMSSRTIVWRAILGQSGLINTLLGRRARAVAALFRIRRAFRPACQPVSAHGHTDLSGHQPDR